MGSTLKVMKDILVNPVKFYDSVAADTKYWTVLKHILIAMIAISIIQVVLPAIPQLFRGSIFGLNLLIFAGTLIFLVILSVIGALTLPFIASGIIHLGVMLLKGKQGYHQTFKAVSYSMLIGVPYTILVTLIAMLLGYNQFSVDALMGTAFPPIGFLIASLVINLMQWIHITVVQVVGLTKMQKFSLGKAVLAVVIAYLLWMLIILILLIPLFLMSVLSAVL